MGKVALLHLIVGVLLGSATAGVCRDVYYEQDFSSEPTEWVASDPALFSWHSAAKAYNLTSSNGSGEYVYSKVPFNPQDDWSLDYDIFVHSIDGTGIASIGLWDPEMRYNTHDASAGSSYVRVSFGRDYSGNHITLHWVGQDDDTKKEAMVGGNAGGYNFRLGEWYHTHLEFHRASGTCRIIVNEGTKSGANPVMDMSLTGVSGGSLLSSDVDRIASTGIGVWSSSGASSYTIDNVILTPEVSTLSIGPGIEGDWVNPHQETRGMTRLKITRQGDNWKVQGWGQCHPHDCDWGEVDLHLVSAGIRSRDYRHAFATWEPGFKTNYMLIRIENNQLFVETISVYHDRSGRSNRRQVFMLQRPSFRWPERN